MSYANPSTSAPISMPSVWMQLLCSGSVPAILNLYADAATLVPTYSKTDLPGAGVGVLRGKQQIVNYFNRFMGKKQLCGTIDTVVEQGFGPVSVYSGLYTFGWRENGRAKSAKARYTYVTITSPLGPKIVSHHSSAVP